MAKARDDEALHRMIDAGASPDFTDPKLEWRRVLAEGWGAFLLVAAAAGAAICADVSPDKISYGAAAVAPGLAVMVVIYM
ncbi:MAG TPA: hypothetical protein VKU90_15755, partial [Caulobacteraceae bacterium]|nr:hypothetical protein [Caulobacteraceae bacterium]